MLSKGEIVAALVALGFKGHVGPMGGEDPILDENKMVLYSQCPETGYRFNDDGSVDVYYPDENATYDSLVHDCGMTEEEAEEEIKNPPHYDTIKDLFYSDDGWFYYFTTDFPQLSLLIIQLSEVLSNENPED